jgi:hypothetical protein
MQWRPVLACIVLFAVFLLNPFEKSSEVRECPAPVVQHINTPSWTRDEEIRKQTKRLVASASTSEDAALHRYIRRLLVPPSRHSMRKIAGPLTLTPQGKAVKKIFSQRVRN